MNEGVVHLNWTRETERLEKFLASDDRVLHVVGSEACYANHFDQIIAKAIGRRGDSTGGVAFIDPMNQTTSSPLGALTSILRDLNFEPASGAGPGPGGRSILSHIRAGRDLSISDVSLTVSRNEGEELLALSELVKSSTNSDCTFVGSVVVFRQCHEMKMRQRKLFWANVWRLALVDMLARGLKAIFLYCPVSLTIVDDAIPPRADRTIRLPELLSESDVLGQIATLVSANGYAESGSAAEAFARAILWTSTSVRDVYENLTVVALRHGGQE